MFVVCGEALWDLFAVEGEPLAFAARPGGSPFARGAAGAEAFFPAGRVAAAGRAVPVADCVGAGDAFQAALIAGRAECGLRDRRAPDALGREAIAGLLAFANAAATIACTRRGAQLPRRADLPPLSMEVS